MKNIKVKNNINDLIVDCIRPGQLENLKELEAHFDSRKSFYKKAYTGTFDGVGWHALYLKSYDTIVACIFENQLRIYGGFSQTTARHIREFALQNGFREWIPFADIKNTCVISK